MRSHEESLVRVFRNKEKTKEPNTSRKIEQFKDLREKLQETKESSFESSDEKNFPKK
jgi:hypothetical protein